MTSPTNAPETGKGGKTRRVILEAAARLASTDGLEGLSIGRLADHVGMSKSGLYAHFRSKEQLQLEAIRVAAEIFEAEVVAAAAAVTPGRDRLVVLCDNYFDYVERRVFPGGCFFVAAALDPVRLRAPVRKLLDGVQRQWLSLLEQWVGEAQELGEVAADVAARDIAFEIESFLAGANINYVLLEDDRYLEQGRAAVRRCLRR